MAQISSQAVFLVSGGGRGITAQCVRAMAAKYGCGFILLGRTAITEPEPAWAQSVQSEAELKALIVADIQKRGEKPHPLKVQAIFGSIVARREVLETLAAIQKGGGRAEYISVDITNQAELQTRLAEVAEKSGPITGIIHGAGNLADKRIEDKTAEDFELVYGAKITGLQNILSCVAISSLEYLILFSSVAGFYGNAGQTDYAIANEILNAMAFQFKRNNPACRVLSLNWGPWEGGMVTPELKKLFTDNGVELIPSASGALALLEELENTTSQAVQVLIGSPGKLRDAGKLNPEPSRHRISRSLSLTANPFLQDHQIGGKAVLPAVFSAAWMGHTCEQLYPSYTFFSCERYKVLKGIIFDNDLASVYYLDLNELKIEVGKEIVFEGLIWSETKLGKIRYHYSAIITLRHETPERPVYKDFDLSPTLDLPGAQLYQDGTLFQGPGFQGIERVLNLSSERLTLECTAPKVEERFSGQFPTRNFNPYLADLQGQSMLIWTRHFYQSASLPLQTLKSEVYQSPRPGEKVWVSLEIRSHNSMQLSADIFTHDQAGKIYQQVFGSEVTLSPQLNELFSLKSKI